MKSKVVAVLVIALAFVACADEGSPESNILPGKIQPTKGPYVSVAVDNHFHDVHPNDHIEVAYDRDFVVRNEGSNLHNVTFEGTDINRDVRPGQEIRIPNVGERLGSGVHVFICRYHIDRGMLGQFTVPSPSDGD